VNAGGLERLEARFGTLLEALALVASLALLAMVAIICGDVLTRNVAVPGLPRGIAWSNEISELLLYAMTLLAAPWLLREGRHIRVDILLRVLPAAWPTPANGSPMRWASSAAAGSCSTAPRQRGRAGPVTRSRSRRW
jgi:hypothetical protein